jgi:hypothetical protein
VLGLLTRGGCEKNCDYCEKKYCLFHLSLLTKKGLYARSLSPELEKGLYALFCAALKSKRGGTPPLFRKIEKGRYAPRSILPRAAVVS